jgi:hypothetical protein
VEAQRQELQSISHRLRSNLDYFGNPPGWVPTLSFTVNAALLDEQIQDAVRTDLLARWTEWRVQNMKDAADGLQACVGKLHGDVSRIADEYEQAQSLIPHLQPQIESIDAQRKVVADEMEQRQKDLRKMAKDDVRGPLWRRGVALAGHVLQVVPIYQPVLGAIGTAAVAASNFQKDPLGSVLAAGSALGKIDSEALKKSKVEYDGEIAAIRGEHMKPGEHVKKLLALGQKWGPAYKGIDEAVSSGPPANEIDAELEKLKATDATWAKLVDACEQLEHSEVTLTQELNQDIDLINNASGQITSDLQQIDGMSVTLANTTGKLDHRVLDALKQMQQNARERVRRYQYYVAKAYEYETLEPAAVDYHIQSVVDKIEELLKNSGEPLTLASLLGSADSIPAQPRGPDDSQDEQRRIGA